MGNPSGGQTRVNRRGKMADGDLITVVVEYPGAADRCTIYPADLTESERLTRWLSADRSAFEPLDARR